MTILTRRQPNGKDADRARLIAEIEEALGGPPRCLDCHRQLHVFRSIVLGRGPICLRKRQGGGS
jgi:hypothetical protein